MSITPNFVPREYKTLNILLLVNNAEEALKFYNSAFEAEVTMKLQDENGIIHHAEMRIDDTTIMLAESPEPTSGKGVVFKLYTGDVEGLFESAIKAGCDVISEIDLQYDGDRSGRLKDPFGYEWILATHVEDLTVKEIQQRFHDFSG